MATRRNQDDSDEEEATAIDLRSTSQALRKSIPSRPAPPAPPVKSNRSAAAPPSAPKPKAPIPMHDSLHEPDEEATEFLAVRPSSMRSVEEPPSSSGVAASMRARGRAVPLEVGEPPVVEQPPSPQQAERPARDRRSREPTEPIAVESPPPALPQRAPRPLPDRGTDLRSETQTGDTGTGRSAPRITRIFVPPDATGPQRIQPDDAGDIPSKTDPAATVDERADYDDDATDPPRPAVRLGDLDKPQKNKAADARPARPATIVAISVPEERGPERSDRSPVSPAIPAVPPPAARGDDRTSKRPRTERTSQPTSETLEAEQADGTLIVEVPEGAVVFVNGMERGKGPSLKVTEIDRYARHAVRIHCPGYLPWSGSVCLEGRTAAKVRPGLKKREK